MIATKQKNNKSKSDNQQIPITNSHSSRTFTFTEISAGCKKSLFIRLQQPLFYGHFTVQPVLASASS